MMACNRVRRRFTNRFLRSLNEKGFVFSRRTRDTVHILVVKGEISRLNYQHRITSNGDRISRLIYIIAL